MGATAETAATDLAFQNRKILNLNWTKFGAGGSISTSLQPTREADDAS